MPRFNYCLFKPHGLGFPQCPLSSNEPGVVAAERAEDLSIFEIVQVLNRLVMRPRAEDVVCG